MKGIHSLFLMGAIALTGCGPKNSEKSSAASKSNFNLAEKNKKKKSGASCDKENDLGMAFCDIPFGTFIMGSPTNETGHTADEGPQHQVTISHNFEMSETEVTQEIWQKIMGSNPSESDDEDYPVEKVSWNMIMNSFIPKLNAALSDEGYTYRLPTEAEWEYAARGGKTGPYGVDGDIDDFAWYNENSDDEPEEVADQDENAYGLYDMHGNVWEWVLDTYETYQANPVTDPMSNNGTNRVVRGGGWDSNALACRSANRNYADPDSKKNNTGFRLVRVK